MPDSLIQRFESSAGVLEQLLAGVRLGPSVPTTAEVGDLWIDTTSAPVLKKCASVSPITFVALEGTNSHEQIDTHIGSAANPHSTTKAQVGLGNVTDEAQIAKSIGTVKGDIIGFSGSGVPASLVVGVNDQVLTADSAQALGVKWATAAGGGESEVIVRLGSAVSNSTVTLADITGLSFSALANADYIFEAWLIFQSAATATGIALAANGPASPVAFVMQRAVQLTLTTGVLGHARAYNSGAASASVDTANVDCIATLNGILRNGANAGTFVLRFASEVAGSAVTIKVGSVLRYRKTN